ncbi:MAG: FG-GAP-like repeat-containing protein [Acidobacteria bacterium]|nr:FG-GAP-like repeat-containing protein [Acidobacteriota bacterium]
MRSLFGKLLLPALLVMLAATPAAADVYFFQVSPATVPAGGPSNATVTVTFDYFSVFLSCGFGTATGSATFRWSRAGFSDVTTTVSLPNSFGGNLLTATLTIPANQLQSPGSGTITVTSTYYNISCAPSVQPPTAVGTVNAVAPTISKPIVPTATSSGGASLPITVYGDNFVPGQSKIAFDGTSLTSTAVAGKVTATIPGGSLTAGVHKVRIRNNDAITTNPPDSGEVDFLVGTATTTTVTSSSSAAVLGQSTTLTATVTGGSSLTGRVTFYDGGQVLGTSSLSGGAATLATRFLASGVRRIRAIYQGNSSSAPSQSAVFNQTVQGLGATGFLSAAGSPVAVGNRPFGLASGDFNEDGRLDLAVPNASSNSVSILLGNSSGGFTAGTAVTGIFGSGGEPSFVATGDFNQDGNVDFVVSSNSNRGARVYQGNGAGSFSSLATLDLPTDANPLGLAVADFNGDGNADIAVVDHSVTERLYVFLSPGDGTFASVPPLFLLNSSDPWVPVAADFDNDGRIDLAIPNRATGIDSISIYRGVGDGTFLAAVNYSTGSGSRPAMAAVGDFDQNGQPDIVTANAGGGSVSVLLNNGGGTFGAPSVFSTGTGAAGVAVEDFNGDGLVDIASVNFTAGNVTILINDLSNRGQNFTNQTRYSFPAGSSAGYLVTGDFNRDGRPDMALTLSNTSGTVSIGLGTGPGITSLSRTSAVAGTPGLTFNINGSNFITGSKVRWNRGGTISLIPDDGGSVTFVSASQLTVVIPTALLTTPNSTTSVDVAISVVDPLAASSDSTTFTVTPGPAISSVTPDLPLVVGGGNRTLVVGGANFATGAILRWRVGGTTTNLTTSRQSAAQLTGTLPGSLITTAGSAFVSALDTGGASSTEFSVTVAAPATLTAISPSAAGGGSSALTITLTGTGFANTSQVRWCNACSGSPTSLPTTFVSATQLTATISAPLLAAVGTATVTVFDTASTTTTAAQTFSISSPAITTLTPSSATAGAAAFTMTVTGTGFVPGAAVQWCNSCAGSFTDLTTNFVDAQTLTATVSSGLLNAAGTVTVRVANNSVVVSPTRTFSIVPVSLSSVQPNVVLAGTSNFAFTLTGQNFQTGAVVLWNNGATTGPITITHPELRRDAGQCDAAFKRGPDSWRGPGVTA